MVIWIHLHSQVKPHLWNYSIFLIHCVVSSHCSQTPARKTLHPTALGRAKRKATAPEAAGLPAQYWSVWQNPPQPSPGGDSGIPYWGGWSREGRAVPPCPSPWAKLGGPAAARPLLPTHVVYRCLKESWALLCLIPRPCLQQPRQPHHNTFKIAVQCQSLCQKNTFAWDNNPAVWVFLEPGGAWCFQHS